jgi:hypothetical protein
MADLKDGDSNPDELREIIIRAKAGDPAAKEQLYRRFTKKLRKIAGNAEYSGPPFSDRLSAAIVAFWEAYDAYDLTRPEAFWSYASKFVFGAVCDVVTDWHYRGVKDESRAARKARAEHRPIHAEYNGVESSCYDTEGRQPISEPIAGWIAADEYELQWCDGSGGKINDAQWSAVVAGRAIPTNWPGRGAPEPCKPISRSRYEEDQALAHSFDTAAYFQRRASLRLTDVGRRYGVPRECFGIDENPRRNGGRYPRKIIGTYGFDIPRAVKGAKIRHRAPERHRINPPRWGNAPALGIIGWLAVQTDLRAMRRLARIGRRRYALELAAKDLQIAVKNGEAIVPLFEPTVPQEYSVPVNTSHKPEKPSDSKQAPSLPAMPLVWDYRDRWEWKRISILPDEIELKTSAQRRMATLAIAVDNEAEYGNKYDDALQPGSNLHRADRSDNRDVRQVRRAAS